MVCREIHEVRTTVALTRWASKHCIVGYPVTTAAAAAASSHNPDEDDVSVPGWEHMSPTSASREMTTLDSNEQDKQPTASQAEASSLIRTGPKMGCTICILLSVWPSVAVKSNQTGIKRGDKTLEGVAVSAVQIHSLICVFLHRRIGVLKERQYGTAKQKIHILPHRSGLPTYACPFLSGTRYEAVR